MFKQQFFKITKITLLLFSLLATTVGLDNVITAAPQREYTVSVRREVPIAENEADVQFALMKIDTDGKTGGELTTYLTSLKTTAGAKAYYDSHSSLASGQYKPMLQTATIDTNADTSKVWATFDKAISSDDIDNNYLLYELPRDAAKNYNRPSVFKVSDLLGTEAESTPNQIEVNDKVEPALGTAEFTKTDNNGTALAGSTFELYRYNPENFDPNEPDGVDLRSPGENATKVGESATSAETTGKVIFAEIDYKEHAKNNTNHYYIVETDATDYYKLSNEIKTFTLTNAEINWGSTDEETFANEPFIPVVKYGAFQKVDLLDGLDDPLHLTGAIFDLYSKTPTGDFTPEQQNIASTTDGLFQFSINLGTQKDDDTPFTDARAFYILETKAPDNYFLPTTPNYIPIDLYDSAEAALEPGTQVNNTPEAVTGNAYFQKVVATSNAALAGAEFELWETTEANYNDRIATGGTKVGTATSAEDGLFSFEDLDLGKLTDTDANHYFYLIETKTPGDNDYHVAAPLFFFLNHDTREYPNPSVSPGKINNVPTENVVGDAHFKKVVAGTQTALPDATFALYEFTGENAETQYTNAKATGVAPEGSAPDNGTAQVAITQSNELGLVNFTDIDLGLNNSNDTHYYYTIETAAPGTDQYEKTDKAVYFTLNRDSASHAVPTEEEAAAGELFENTPITDITGDAHFKKVDNHDTGLAGAVFELRAFANEDDYNEAVNNGNLPATAGNLISETTSKGNGDVDFDTIPLGRSSATDNNQRYFYVIEKTAPAHYSKDNDHFVAFELHRNSETDANAQSFTASTDDNFVNTPIPVTGNAHLNKVDNKGGALNGAEFDLYEFTGTADEFDEAKESGKAPATAGTHVETVKSGEGNTSTKGDIFFKNIALGDEVEGQDSHNKHFFYVVEKTSPTHYNGTDKAVYFELSNSNPNFTATEGDNFVNTPIPVTGNAHLNKVDANNAALNGAEFELYEFNGTADEFSTAKDSGKAPTTAGTLVKTVTSGVTDTTTKGDIFFKDIALGDQVEGLESGNQHFFYVIEKTPPTHYTGTNKAVYFELSNSGLNFNASADDNFVNTPIPVVGDAHFKKIDKKTGQPLNGATFTLQEIDEATYEASHESNIVPTNELNGSWYSDTVVSGDAAATGAIDFTNIPLGTEVDDGAVHYYYIAETEPALGYEATTEARYFTLQRGEKQTHNEIGANDGIENTQTEIFGNAYFEKIDAETRNPLNGATFILYESDADGNKLDAAHVYEKESGELGNDGAVSFTDLPLGTLVDDADKTDDADKNVHYFTLEETAAPASGTFPVESNYAPSNTKVTFKLDRGTRNFHAPVSRLQIENTPLYGTGDAHFTKHDANSEPLGDAKFELREFTGDNAAADYEAAMTNGTVAGNVDWNLVDEATSDENGHIDFTDIALGQYNEDNRNEHYYFVVETDTPAGYAKTTVTQFFTLNRDEPSYSSTIAFANTPIPVTGNARLHKVDNQGHALNNATFKLYEFTGTPEEFATAKATGKAPTNTGAYIATATSGEANGAATGEIVFKDIALGNEIDNPAPNKHFFYVVETEPTQNYAGTDKAVYFELNSDNLNFTATEDDDFVNTPIPVTGNAHLKKVNDQNTPLNGAIFELFEFTGEDAETRYNAAVEAGVKPTSGEFTSRGTATSGVTNTTTNGDIFFKNIALGDKVEGQTSNNKHFFYVVEKTPTTHYAGTDKVVFFDLNATQLDFTAAADDAFVNTPIPVTGSALLKKVDAQLKPLDGATFELRELNNEATYNANKDSGKAPTTAGSLVATVTSGDNNTPGNVFFNNIDLGDETDSNNNRHFYYVVEKAAPTHYSRSEKAVYFELNRSNHDFTAVDNDFMNTPIPVTGDAHFTKIDSTTKTPLNGAEFELYETTSAIYSQNVETNTVPTDSDKGTLRAATTSGNSGKAGAIDFANIALGDEAEGVDSNNLHFYYVIEKQAPTGYVIAKPKALYFTLNSDTRTFTAPTTDAFENQPLGKAFFQKVDEADPKKPLAGAEFELYAAINAGETSADDVLISTQASDVNGLLVFTGQDGKGFVIPEGTSKYFYLKEKVAPFGYEKLETPFFFMLDSSNNFGSLASPTQIKNKRLPIPHDPITKTEASGHPSYDFVGLETTKSWILRVNLPSTLSKMDRMDIADNYAKNWNFIPGSTQIIATMKDGSVRTLVPGVDYTETATPAANKVAWNFWKDGKAVTAGAQIDNVQSLKVTYSTQVNPPKNGPWHGLASSYIEDPSKNVATLTYKPTNGPEVSYDDKAEVWTGGQHFMKQDPGKQPLNKAQFVVYRVVNGKNEYLKYVKVGDDPRGKVTWVAKQSQATKLKSGDGWPDDQAKADKTGKFSVTGLADGDYWLKETKAPALGSGISFELLKEPAKFTITKESWNGSVIRITNVLSFWDPETEGKEPTPKKPNPKKPIVVVPLPGNNTFPVTGGMVTTTMLVLAGIWIISIAIRVAKPKKRED